MSYNTPVRHLQQGSVLEVGPSGTVLAASGGSIQVASGAVLSVAGSIVMAAGGAFNNAAGTSTSAGLTIIASGGTHLYQSGGSLQVASGGAVSIAAATGFSAPAGITLGGTAGKWAFGTLGLANGIGSVQTNLTTVISATATSLSGVQGGAGSMSTVVIDPLNFANGSVIFRGLAGTLAFTGNNGTVAWWAIGV